MIPEGTKIADWTVGKETTPYVNPSSGCKLKRYLCECVCGTIKPVRESSLKEGGTSDCGCKRNARTGDRMRKHGKYSHRLYNRWWDMLRRCEDYQRKDYKHYGGRGIKVCERWRDHEIGFTNFCADMEASFIEGLEIDRIDVDGDYTPENCRWATRRTQVINKRPDSDGVKLNIVHFQGKSLCLSQWEDETGIPSYVLSDRLGKLKWSVEKALTTPVRKRKE